MILYLICKLKNLLFRRLTFKYTNTVTWRPKFVYSCKIIENVHVIIGVSTV